MLGRGCSASGLLYDWGCFLYKGKGDPSSALLLRLNKDLNPNLTNSQMTELQNTP